jgi:hypothetical protein
MQSMLGRQIRLTITWLLHTSQSNLNRKRNCSMSLTLLTSPVKNNKVRNSMNHFLLRLISLSYNTQIRSLKQMLLYSLCTLRTLRELNICYTKTVRIHLFTQVLLLLPFKGFFYAFAGGKRQSDSPRFSERK